MTRKPDPIAPAQATAMISKQEGAMKDFYADRRLEDTAGQCLWAYRQWLRHGHSIAIPRLWRWATDTDAAMRYPARNHEWHDRC
jgi:hypothetical protein